MRHIRQLLGDDDTSVSGEFEELVSNSILTECLLFCCRAFSEQGLSSESEKTLRLLEGCDNALPTRIRVWNEVGVERGCDTANTSVAAAGKGGRGGESAPALQTVSPAGRGDEDAGGGDVADAGESDSRCVEWGIA